MTPISFTRGASPHGRPDVASISICTPWNTKRDSSPLTLSTPFVRNMSAPRSCTSSVIQVLKRSSSTVPSQRMPTEVTVSS